MPRPRLSLDDLATFMTIVDCGGFGAAAARLGLAQSTVSQQGKRLEEALGTPLLLRSQRGARPTEAALRVLPYAKSLLHIEERAMSAVAGHDARLGACSNIGVYLLPALLRAYRDRGGGAPQLYVAANPDVVRRLARRESDAAVLEWWDERDGFAWRTWRREPLVVIAAPSHPLGGSTSISRSELAKIALIGGEEGTGTGRLLRAYFDGLPMPAVTMQLGSTEAVKRAVEAGLGVSLVLACSVAEEVRSGRLHALALRDGPLEKTLRLVWRSDLAMDEPLLSYLAAAAA
jgi:DNA-binding transcriptional LysR family regulator